MNAHTFSADLARRSLPAQVNAITDMLAGMPAEHVVHVIRASALHGGIRMTEPSEDILSACDALEEAWREEDQRLHGREVGQRLGWGMPR